MYHGQLSGKAFLAYVHAFVIFGHMKVTLELIDRLSYLARLDIAPEAKEQLRGDMEQMIGFIEKLNELDTTGVEPLLHMCAETDVLREDIPGGSIDREAALAPAGKKDEQFFLVPKTIKK